MDLFNNPFGQGQTQNPLQVLLAAMQQHQQPSQAIPMPASAQTAPTQSTSQSPTQNNEVSSLALQAVRGLLNPPPTPDLNQQFNQQYRQSVSPARNLLANILLGVGSGLTGTPFASAKDIAFRRFVQGQKLMEDEQANQRLAAANALGPLASMINNRNSVTAQQQMANARNAITMESDAARNQHNQFMEALGLGNYNLNKQKADETSKQNTIKNNTAYTGMMKDADTQARQTLQSQGVDPNDPQNFGVLNATRTKVYSDLLNKTESTKAKYRPSPQPPSTQLKEQTDSTGMTTLNIWNPKTQSYSPMPDDNGDPIKYNKGTAESQKQYASLLKARDDVNTAMAMAARNPTAVGQWVDAMPAAFQAAIGRNPTIQRVISIFGNQGQLLKTISQSGAQFSEREIDMISQYFPKLFENPNQVQAGLGILSAMLSADALRQKYGASSDNMDFAPILSSYFTAVNKQIEAAPRGATLTITPLNADILLQKAMERYHKTFQTKNGVVYGIKDAR